MRISDWSSDVCSSDLLRRLLEVRLVQRESCLQLLQPRIPALQILHPPHLIDLQAAIFLAPAIQRLFDDPNLSAGFHRGRAAPHQYLHLTQLRDNLLRCKTLTSHPILHSNCPAGLSSELDQFSQGRPRAAKAHRASAIGNAVSAPD